MWPNPQETADLVTFNEEIFNGKLQFFAQFYINFLNPEIYLNYQFIYNNPQPFSTISNDPQRPTTMQESAKTVNV